MKFCGLEERSESRLSKKGRKLGGICNHRRLRLLLRKEEKGEDAKKMKYVDLKNEKECLRAATLCAVECYDEM